MQKPNKLYILILCFILCKIPALADVIYLKNGKEIKGIIVEDYKDRVMISTYEGEKTVPKKDIQKMVYDLIEQNLVKMGDTYMSRREYEKAYFYYEKARKANPDYKLAREKLNYVMGYLFRKREKEKLDDIKRRQEFEKWPSERRKGEEEKDIEKELEDSTGIEITEEENRIKIKKVLEDSPADVAGLKANDILISLWGKFTGYMSEEEVARLLVEEGVGELKIAMERDVTVKKEAGFDRNYKNIIGGKINVLENGLTISDLEHEGRGWKAGLKNKDLIIAINGTQTRYMPLKTAVRIIENRNNDKLIFTVQRDVTMWRK